MNIEEQIRRAMEEGQFENLPGKGKPLKLEGNAFEDPEWRMANKILRDGGFTLPWIEKRQKIEADLELARASLKRAWIWRQKGLIQNRPFEIVDGEWQRAEAVFREQIAVINKLIFAYNLEVPLPRFQRLVIDAAREVKAIKEDVVEDES
jgi:DnaJ family protein C protein 28